MNFTSVTFLFIFLPIFLVLYYLIPNIFLKNISKDKSIIYNLLPLGDGLLVIQNNN